MTLTLETPKRLENQKRETIRIICPAFVNPQTKETSLATVELIVKDERYLAGSPVLSKAMQESDGNIFVSSVEAESMELFLEWLVQLADHPGNLSTFKSLLESQQNGITPWETEFLQKVNTDVNRRFKLLIASEYFDSKTFMKLMCFNEARHIRGKTGKEFLEEYSQFLPQSSKVSSEDQCRSPTISDQEFWRSQGFTDGFVKIW